MRLSFTARVFLLVDQNFSKVRIAISKLCSVTRISEWEKSKEKTIPVE